ncbi:GMC oxidoreductase [Acidocella sp.]|uniref:GMC oxidoreductase n=1 Tax=Acidocella sp. TaxID=50710 RepID=UPI003CFF8BFD
MRRRFQALCQAPEGALDSDVCVVGTGPAGAALARELSGSGLRVLLVESGGMERRPEADALNEVENAGHARIEDQWLVRNRILGGTSHTWSGRCVPFDDIDFRPRAWVPQSGWPLQPGELRPYLERAAPYLGLSVGTGFAGDGFWELAGRRRRIPAFDEDRLIPHFWQFSRAAHGPRGYTRFGPPLPEQLGKAVTLLLNTTLCDIHLNEACDKVAAITLAGEEGERRLVPVKALVLCCGGIENARLLLCANGQIPAGIGNARDQVGRYLMDHLRGPTGQFSLRGTARLRRVFGHYRIAGGQVFAAGLRLSPAMQAQEGLLNASAWLEGRIAGDDPWNAMKALARGRAGPRQMVDIAGNAGLLLRGVRDHVLARNGLPRKIDRLDLVCMIEQWPDPESRVRLSSRRDRLGMPLARIDWRVHEEEARSLRRLTALVAVEFTRLGLPPLHPEAWVAMAGPLPEMFMDVAHPTGTTRMGDDPARSVVDRNSQVHGVSGLFVAGSSVFPTSSHANPTQMIVALALRLADRLRARQ